MLLGKDIISRATGLNHNNNIKISYSVVQQTEREYREKALCSIFNLYSRTALAVMIRRMECATICSARSTGEYGRLEVYEFNRRCRHVPDQPRLLEGGTHSYDEHSIELGRRAVK